MSVAVKCHNTDDDSFVQRLLIQVSHLICFLWYFNVNGVVGAAAVAIYILPSIRSTSCACVCVCGDHLNYDSVPERRISLGMSVRWH